MLDLFDEELSVFHRYVPAFEPEIANLTAEDDAKLKTLGVIGAVVLLMKH